MELGENAPSLLERLPSLEWDRLTREMMGVALRRGASVKDAEDYAQQAITRAWDAGSRARQMSTVEDLTKYLCQDVNELRKQALKKKRRQNTASDTPLVEESAPVSRPDLEFSLVQRERVLAYSARLRKALARTTLPLKILDVYEQGILTADELVVLLGEAPDAIYNARRTILNAVRKLLAEGSDPDIQASVSP